MKKIALSAADVDNFHTQYHESAGCWNWTGPDGARGYGLLRVDKEYFLAHRVSYLINSGKDPYGKLVDHICHNRRCVRPEHLRLVNHKQNGENRAGLQRNNSTGVQGVYWNEGHQKFHARVQHFGKRIHVGMFNTLAEAEDAVVAKRLELFTHNELDRAA